MHSERVMVGSCLSPQLPEKASPPPTHTHTLPQNNLTAFVPTSPCTLRSLWSLQPAVPSTNAHITNGSHGCLKKKLSWSVWKPHSCNSSSFAIGTMMSLILNWKHWVVAGWCGVPSLCNNKDRCHYWLDISLLNAADANVPKPSIDRTIWNWSNSRYILRPRLRIVFIKS